MGSYPRRAYCQHQTAWLLDQGHPNATAFVGGINPTFEIF
jgi:cardiolipin synthase A/B